MTCALYFMQSGEAGPFKIGVAEDPVTRVRELQTGNPEQIHLRWKMDIRSRDIAWAYEAALHGALSKHRCFGREWFQNNYTTAKILSDLRAAEALLDPGTAVMDFSLHVPFTDHGMGAIAVVPRFVSTERPLPPLGHKFCWRCECCGGSDSPLAPDYRSDGEIGEWQHILSYQCVRAR